MASNMHPKGNWVFRILIVVFLILLLTSIHYPKKLWDEQERLTIDSRERMENLNFVIQRFHTVNGYYHANLNELLDFIEKDSIEVRRPLFEIERLSLYDSESDSFLIGFIDRYHFEEIVTEVVNEDSIILKMIPKPVFADVIKPSVMVMTCEKGIKDSARGKGEDDIYHLVWSRGNITRYDLPYDTINVATKDYLLFRKTDDINTDPISSDQYKLDLNARVTIEGKVTYAFPRNGEPEASVIKDELMTNLLINKLARKARAKVDALLKKDTTLFEQQLSLQGDYFEVELAGLASGKTIEIEDSREIVTPIDSVDSYRDSAVIKSNLFHTVYDSLIKVWSNLPQTTEIISKMTFEESYELVKIDTIGVRIKPPFGEEFQLPSRGILSRIFNVGPVDNPGFIDNNDLSWEEKR
ncbi:MAG: hypothetical protein P9L92_20515 [Candidatus Electryonea clarkiae]|nr:hypothetical protein [Candidatus Electryonea clarkiae]MDP8285081.1 hypothetical protein [Candidatus Electryonea clarkiae]